MPLDGSQSRNPLLDARKDSPALERRRAALIRLVEDFVAEGVARTRPGGNGILYRGPKVRQTTAGRAILEASEEEREACLALAFSWMGSIWSELDENETFPTAEHDAAYSCLYVLFLTLLDRLPGLGDLALGILVKTQAALPATEEHFHQLLDDVLDLIERAAIERGLPPILEAPLRALHAGGEKAWPNPNEYYQAFLDRTAGLAEEARVGRRVDQPSPKLRTDLESFVADAAKLDLGLSRRAKVSAIPAGARILQAPAEERATFLLPVLRRLAVLCMAEGRLLHAGPYDERLNHLSALASALLRAKLPLSDADLTESLALTSRAWARMPCTAVLARVERFLDEATPSRALMEALSDLRMRIRGTEELWSLDSAESALLQRVEDLLYRHLAILAPEAGEAAERRSAGEERSGGSSSGPPRRA